MNKKRYIPYLNGLTTSDVENARAELNVGDIVSFTQPRPYGRRKTIRGTITGKFQYIFLLNNGKSYQYVDYVMGGGCRDDGLHAM